MTVTVEADKTAFIRGSIFRFPHGGGEVYRFTDLSGTVIWEDQIESGCGLVLPGVYPLNITESTGTPILLSMDVQTLSGGGDRGPGVNRALIEGLHTLHRKLARVRLPNVMWRRAFWRPTSLLHCSGRRRWENKRVTWLTNENWHHRLRNRGLSRGGEYPLHKRADVVSLAGQDFLAASNSCRAQHPEHTTNYEDILSRADVDAVSIAVPNHLHAPIAIAALRAGKHVLLEKPIGLSAAEGEQIVAEATAAGKVFGISFNKRYRADVELLKAQAKAGALGEIYYAKAFWMRRAGIPGLAPGSRARIWPAEAH